MTYPRRGLQLMDESMLLSIPEGRYAWQPDVDTPLTFIWIRDYTWGKRNGQRRIRTQHGPYYEDALTRLPAQPPTRREPRILIFDPTIEDVLLGVFCDRTEAALRYGQELQKCCRCNAELTDVRSRWYSLGPECEHYWPWFIEDVNNRKGYSFEERGLHGQDLG